MKQRFSILSAIALLGVTGCSVTHVAQNDSQDCEVYIVGKDENLVIISRHRELELEGALGQNNIRKVNKKENKRDETKKERKNV